MSCKECSMHNITKRGYNPLKSIVLFESFEYIGLDMMGQLPVTDKKNCYILVVVDICTKYVIVRPAPNKQSDTIASLLISTIFADYGCTVNVTLSDHRREYKNFLSSYINKALNIEKVVSNPFYPQGNSHSENAVKFVINTLQKMYGDDTHNWDIRLPIV